MEYKKIFISFFLLLLPFTAILQPARLQLLSILKSYDQLQYLEYSFTYSSLDKNADTFNLENKGELQFTRFKSKTYYRISGLNLDIYFTNKFISRKHFVMKANSEYTTVHDIENSNVRIYEKMDNQLCYTHFKIQQIIPPLLLNDSSDLYNKRFFEKILSEIKLDEKDSLISNIKLEDNYLNKYYRFEISFRNFDENKAFRKWNKYFEKKFILGFSSKRFIIIIDKKSLLPVDYTIKLDSNQFEAYHSFIVSKKVNDSHVSFNPFDYNPVPLAGWRTCMIKGKIQNSEGVLSDKTAFDFTEVNCLNQEKIRLFDSKSEHILLFVWNSQTAENTEDFKKVSNFALKNPDKLMIIGLNNYNESNEYIEKIYKKFNWQFPTIKGREISKKFHISDSPAYILIYKRGNELWINNAIFIQNLSNILTNVSN
jgi:hypothetical protein